MAEPGHTRNLSKVTPPTPHRVHLNRRLFGRLDAASERSIVWIHAPPGAGKTTLAASYLADKDIAPLWYRLDEGDADPATLFLYLSAAWMGRKIGLSLPVLTPDKRPGLPIFARQFFREMFRCPRTSVLVFDDYHEVAPDSLLHQCVTGGMEEIPDGCRVIFVSRAPPPPAFAKLRMNGRIDVIEPDALRLSLDEAKGVAQERGTDVGGGHIEAIVRRTQGWTAGLILMLDAGADALASPAATSDASEVLFDYFAGEILDRMPAERQRLLCTLALMPTMTAAAANRLAGSPQAEELLEEFRRRNYFTVRDTATEPRYRFHPLFRDFLLAQGRTRLSSDEFDQLKIRAASILADSGQAEDATGLLENAGAFDALARLVIQHAESLMDEGRYDTLAAWLAKIPRTLIDTNAWLTYWSGAVHVFHRPAECLPKLTKAFELFRKADDVVGQYVAWARQAEAIRLDAFGDNARFDALLDTMDDLRARHPEVPPGSVMLRVALSLAIGLSRRTNRRDQISYWQDQARAAAKLASNDILSNTIGYWFAICDFHDANIDKACSALDALPDPLTMDHRSFVADVSGFIAVSNVFLYRQRAGDCRAYCEEALRRMEAEGSFVWSHQLAGIAAGDAHRRHDLAAYAMWLRRVGEYADRVSPRRGAHYYYAAAHYDLATGHLSTALDHADAAVGQGIDSGWPFFEAIGRSVRSEILIEMGRFDEGEAELLCLDELRARSATRIVDISTGFLKADLAFSRGDEQRGLMHLAEALAFGRRQGLRSIPIKVARTHRLLTKALKADIEADYVRLFIRASGIPAPENGDAIWPWPLKIRTFGGFAVTQYDKPLSFGRKTPKRLVMLLKAIIAYGGRDVPEDKLIDAIWPDEDGDAAHSALTIAIHRLRKLLGDAGLVIVKDGRVSLDPARCWLDSWAFEQKLGARKADETQAVFEDRRREGLALYRGDFLPEDEDLWWTAERRDALRRRRQRALATA